MDLIGQFEVTTMGNQYTLTVVCMLTDCIIYEAFTDKYADTVVSEYLREVYCQ